MNWQKLAWHYIKGKKSGKRSYSQCGEDILIDYIFRLRGISKPSFIDIGANHPYLFNNTIFFYKKGSRGINIDANPELISLFKTFRPGDININSGISSKENDMLDFYIMEDGTLSTFSRQEFEILFSNGKKLKEVKKINLTTIDNILTTHFNGIFPDFLSLDVEGMDLEILQSIDFKKYFPKVICVEAAEYSTIGAGKRKNDLIDFLLSKGYYEYANTNLNCIMVERDFWFINAS